jgi:hypothetical protein
MWSHTDCTSTGSVSVGLGPHILSVSMELIPDSFSCSIIVETRLKDTGTVLGAKDTVEGRRYKVSALCTIWQERKTSNP